MPLFTPSQDEIEKMLKPTMDKAVIFGVVSVLFLSFLIVTYGKNK